MRKLPNYCKALGHVSKVAKHNPRLLRDIQSTAACTPPWRANFAQLKISHKADNPSAPVGACVHRAPSLCAHLAFFNTPRKLLKVIEMLQLERADCHTHQTICKQSLGQYGSQGSRCTRRSTKKPKNATHTRGDGSVRHQGNWVTPAFVSGEVIEVRQLRLENRNMHLLLAENRELKRDARGVREKENEVRISE